ncbi:MAG: hypothetical protein ACKO0Z_22405 [Betaproteobacteria bacterium]
MHEMNFNDQPSIDNFVKTQGAQHSEKIKQMWSPEQISEANRAMNAIIDRMMKQ